MIALGCMKAMTEKKILIPEQVSIVGFDDLPFAEISTPRLTSLRVPKQKMGEMAVHRIAEMTREEETDLQSAPVNLRRIRILSCVQEFHFRHEQPVGNR